MKTVATGFLFNGPASYLRNPSNIVDFAIVVPSLFSYLPINTDLKFFKIIRMVRLLRPLRFIGKNENLRISIQALYISAPAIGSLLIIVMLIMLVFAIIGVNLFKGMSYYCNIEFISLPQSQIELLIDTKQDCLNYGGIWHKYHYHLDNTVNAIV